MHKIFIIHFQPLEQYPPVMNLLRFLSKENTGTASIHAVSTLPAGRRLLQLPGVSIHRPARWSKPMSAMKRAWLYIAFNFSALWLLIRNRPSKVLYYETMSAFPAVWYKKLFNRSAALFVHYHEYTSPAEYASGSLLNRWLHRLERSVMPAMQWVSHTNADRLNLFIRDLGGKSPVQTAVVENLPPAAWKVVTDGQHHPRTDIIRFVYVGAFSLDTLFVKEWASFVQRYPLKYYWDIYSDNYTEEAIAWIQHQNAMNIHFKGAVPYDALPATLVAYDVGLILYKGHIPNYVYNAPNKLFEYLACGLDVLFPESMVGCMPYANANAYPKVVAVDFTTLSESVIDKAVERSGLNKSDSTYYYETNLLPLTNRLLHA